MRMGGRCFKSGRLILMPVFPHGVILLHGMLFIWHGRYCSSSKGTCHCKYFCASNGPVWSNWREVFIVFFSVSIHIFNFNSVMLCVILLTSGYFEIWNFVAESEKRCILSRVLIPSIYSVIKVILLITLPQQLTSTETFVKYIFKSCASRVKWYLFVQYSRHDDICFFHLI